MIDLRFLLGGAALALTAPAPGAFAATYDHVLMISVDGLHGIDLSNYISSHPNSALAKLASHGAGIPMR